MTSSEAVKWITNILADIGQPEHSGLWDYEQALSEIKELLESEQHHDEWCTDCKEYDKEKHCCPRFNRVIKTAMEDASRWIPVEAKLPEDRQECLLTIVLSGRKYVEIGTYSTDLYSVDKYDFADRKGVAGWHYVDSEYGNLEHVGDVVAWMPMPKAYNGKE